MLNNSFLNETETNTTGPTLNLTLEPPVPNFQILSTVDGFVSIAATGQVPVGVSEDVFEQLISNNTVRVIIKYDERPQLELGEGTSFIHSRKLMVTEIDYDLFVSLLSTGVETIYLDKQMSASTIDTIPLIGADLVQSNLSITGAGIGICLLDSGVDYNATQFNGTVVNGYDFVNEDSDAMDDHGHGTFMASVIHKVAPDAAIVAVKVLDDTGVGYSSDIIEGIEYCRAELSPITLKHSQCLSEEEDIMPTAAVTLLQLQ